MRVLIELAHLILGILGGLADAIQTRDWSLWRRSKQAPTGRRRGADRDGDRER